MENLKKIGRKLRKIYSKNYGFFKNSKPRVQFYWLLCRKKCKLLQQSHCKKAIAPKPSESDVLFLIFNSFLFISFEKSNDANDN